MKYPVDPVNPPRRKVEPLRLPKIHLGDTERFMFDLWAQEHTRISGTNFEYFPIDLAESKKDPLYNEAETRVFGGPFKIIGWIELPIGTSEMQEEGMHKTFGPKAWLARKEVEDQSMPAPKIGDVLHVWDLPFYEVQSTSEIAKSPGAGFYFEVTEVNTDGQLFDTPSFVGFTMNLRRRTEFTPERRLDKPRIVPDPKPHVRPPYQVEDYHEPEDF